MNDLFALLLQMQNKQAQSFSPPNEPGELCDVCEQEPSHMLLFVGIQLHPPGGRYDSFCSYACLERYLKLRILE